MSGNHQISLPILSKLINFNPAEINRKPIFFSVISGGMEIDSLQFD